MFNYKIQCGLLLAVFMLLPSIVTSRELSYDFIQGTYSSVTDSSLPGGDIDGDGLGVSGSLGITQNLALTAGFNATSFDSYQGIDIDTSEFVLGVTLHAPIAVGTDVVANFSALKAKVEVSDGVRSYDDNDTGVVAGIGLRHLATNSIEVDVGFSYTDVFDDGFSTFGLGVRFYANEKISFGIGYATGDDVDALLLNARFDI
jgi:hypothetical protein